MIGTFWQAFSRTIGWSIALLTFIYRKLSAKGSNKRWTEAPFLNIYKIQRDLALLTSIKNLSIGHAFSFPFPFCSFMEAVVESTGGVKLIQETTAWREEQRNITPIKRCVSVPVTDGTSIPSKHFLRDRCPDICTAHCNSPGDLKL